MCAHCVHVCLHIRIKLCIWAKENLLKDEELTQKDENEDSNGLLIKLWDSHIVFIHTFVEDKSEIEGYVSRIIVF